KRNPWMRTTWRPWLRAFPLLTLALLGLACTTGSASSSGSGLQVVAAENFWGSIAAQLGGDNVRVTNIINSQDADPHDHEPTPSDARALAGGRVGVIYCLG